MRTPILIAILWMTPFFSQAEQSLTLLKNKPQAPDFVLADLDGKKHRFSSLTGKPMIVSFWATWCPPCRAELPSMNRAWKKLKDEGILMLAINVGEDEDTIFTFTGDYPIDFPILLDQSGEIVQHWPIRGLPTTFVVDPEGRLAYRAVGGREWDDEALLEKVRALNHEKALTQ